MRIRASIAEKKAADKAARARRLDKLCAKLADICVDRMSEDPGRTYRDDELEVAVVCAGYSYTATKFVIAHMVRKRSSRGSRPAPTSWSATRRAGDEQQ